MANTYNLIEAQTINSNQTSVTIGSGGTIPQTYTDLMLLISTDSNGYNGLDTYMKFNGDSAAYSIRYLWKDGSGGTAYADGASSQSSVLLGWTQGTQSTANTFASFQVHIPNYTSGNYKSFSVENVHEANSNDNWIWMMNGLWSKTPAITSITILAGGTGYFVPYSSFYLYGIKNS